MYYQYQKYMYFSPFPGRCYFAYLYYSIPYFTASICGTVPHSRRRQLQEEKIHISAVELSIKHFMGHQLAAIELSFEFEQTKKNTTVGGQSPLQDLTSCVWDPYQVRVLIKGKCSPTSIEIDGQRSMESSSKLNLQYLPHIKSSVCQKMYIFELFLRQPWHSQKNHFENQGLFAFFCKYYKSLHLFHTLTYRGWPPTLL